MGDFSQCGDFESGPEDAHVWGGYWTTLESNAMRMSLGSLSNLCFDMCAFYLAACVAQVLCLPDRLECCDGTR